MLGVFTNIRKRIMFSITALFKVDIINLLFTHTNNMSNCQYYKFIKFTNTPYYNIKYMSFCIFLPNKSPRKRLKRTKLKLR